MYQWFISTIHTVFPTVQSEPAFQLNKTERNLQRKKNIAMKGKYITTQILLACLSKPVEKSMIQMTKTRVMIVPGRKVLEPMVKRQLVEA